MKGDVTCPEAEERRKIPWKESVLVKRKLGEKSK
jgi:hypothetical protein